MSLRVVNLDTDPRDAEREARERRLASVKKHRTTAENGLTAALTAMREAVLGERVSPQEQERISECARALVAHELATARNAAHTELAVRLQFKRLKKAGEAKPEPEAGEAKPEPEGSPEE